MGLTVDTRYERLGASLFHSFSLSAKRTVYDFDRQVNPGAYSRKSNIRRGWSMTHTLRRQLLARIQLNGRYTYTAEDFGALVVESEAQVVEQDNSVHNLTAGMAYNASDQLTISSSYTYRLDRQWTHSYADGDEERRRARHIRQRILSGSVSYNPSTVTRLSMSGSRSRQRSGALGGWRTFDSLNVTYSRTI